MVEIQRGVASEELQNAAKHSFFVEGRGPNSLDYQIIDFFLKTHGVDISVFPLGPSFHVRSVAQALYLYHPNYYFLIDRDYHAQEFVEESWNNFPNPQTQNLLIWRQREIENYFLLPEYLQKSRYLSCSSDELQECIRTTASKRLFLDAANLIILWCEKEVKRECIAKFNDSNWPNGFQTKEEALQNLLIKHNEAQISYNAHTKLHTYPIADLFNKLVNDLLGGNTEPTFGLGTWLAMLHGKHILHVVIDRCFRVRNERGKFLQGNERMKEVIKDLLRLPLEQQPRDFQQLHMLLSGRVK